HGKREGSAAVAALHRARWGCAGRQVDELVRIGHRQVAQQDGIHGAEDGGIGPDAERQSEDSNDREYGRATQLAAAVTKIFKQDVKRSPAPHDSYLLFDESCIAEGTL